MLRTKKSLARRVYATILSSGTNTDGAKEQGGNGDGGGGGCGRQGQCGAEARPFLQA